MKWIYYIIWLLGWFFIFSFLIAPLKPFAVTGGMLTVYFFNILAMSLLVYGFLFINKNLLDGYQWSALDKAFFIIAIILTLLTIVRIFQLISSESTQSNAANTHDFYDDIDAQAEERVSGAPRHAFFGPSNYWECILDRVPGTKNDTIAIRLIVKCQEKFPNPRPVLDRDKVRGFISNPTKDDCLMKYARETYSPLAAKVINASCYQLYQ